MDYQGIVITGTRAAGKSTISKEICRISPAYQIAKAVTTRPPREDDGTEDYEYVNEKTFNEISDLLISAQYDGYSYGIKESTIKEIKNEGKIPILIITPQEASKFNDFSPTKRKFMTFFLDEKDQFLNNRIENRKDVVTSQIIDQREEDRKYAEKCSYTIYNESGKTDIVELIISLWEYRNSGGLIPKRIIELMIKCGMLLNNSNTDQISGASYDLYLGEEYAQDGIKKLNTNNPFVEMKPGDYALVSSKEIANFPRDIAARFDLTVSLFCKGVILSNGPQVDPGFKGGLFCLLFNTSNQTIQLKLHEHYSTIEFIKLIEPTNAYDGNYQDETKVMKYLSRKMEQSAVRELREDVNKLKEAKWHEKTLPLILSAVSIIAAIILTIIVYLKT